MRNKRCRLKINIYIEKKRLPKFLKDLLNGMKIFPSLPLFPLLCFPPLSLSLSYIYVFMNRDEHSSPRHHLKPSLTHPTQASEKAFKSKNIEFLSHNLFLFKKYLACVFAYVYVCVCMCVCVFEYV